MARDNRPDRRGRRMERRYTTNRRWLLAAVVCAVLGGAGEAATRQQAPLEPYGTDAEVVQCVANMRAALRGGSILGSRDTAAFIQDQGFLEYLGVTEYDVMVGRCRTKFFHRYNRFYGRQPQ
jgi:hypothetical protein